MGNNSLSLPKRTKFTQKVVHTFEEPEKKKRAKKFLSKDW
jgi:hypothetical protein